MSAFDWLPDAPYDNGLTPGERLVLIALRLTMPEGGRVDFDEIAQRLTINRVSAYRMLQQLRSRGRVQAERRVDGPTTRVFITGYGGRAA